METRSTSRLTRRGFCGALAVAASLGGCSTVAGVTRGRSESVAPPAKGKLLLARGSNFYVFDLATRQETSLTRFPSNVLASSPAASPHRRRIAYTAYLVPKNPKNLGGNDLYVMDASGTHQGVVRTHQAMRGSVEEPAWSADGKTLFATVRAPILVGGQTKGETLTIYQIPLAANALARDITEGQSPTLSPDGRYLGFLIATEHLLAWSLWVANPEGRQARQLFAPHTFQLLRAPRFSPDSQHIAFAALGSPSKPSTKARSSRGELLSLLSPGIAEADGIPMDIWTIRPDGSGLRRLTHAADHSPIPAWSPDGKWIAVAGELSLTLVEVASAQSVQLASNAKLSGITWLE